MTEPQRVLQVLASLDRGGAETVVMDWLRHMNRRRVTFDFIVHHSSKFDSFEHEALELGSRIYRVPHSPVNLISYTLWWIRQFRQHPEWQIVHAHHTSPAAIYLAIARERGLVTIAHSHTAGREPTARGVLKQALRWPLRHIADITVGCSDLAVRWMFGRHSSSVIIPNSISPEVYEFSIERRQQIRNEFQSGDALVVGHVGRFHPAKNHRKVLEIFSTITTRSPGARLLLVGDGELRPRIERLAAEFNVHDSVTFTGVRTDVGELLSGMDVLLFPSIFEGLPTSVIEAQAAGLPCVISTSISPEVLFSSKVRALQLEESSDVWADAVLEMAAQSDRSGGVQLIRSSGYDTDSVVERIVQMYEGLIHQQQDRDCPT